MLNHENMTAASVVNRRVFLRYVGAGMTTAFASSLLGPLSNLSFADDVAAKSSTQQPWSKPDGTPAWSPVAYPVPQPGDGGMAAGDATRFATFEVRDDLILPDGFRYDVIAQWGDTFGPANDPSKQITFGFNCDYTGLTPVAGTNDEFFLLVNHEYISGRPWLQGSSTIHGKTFVDNKGNIAGLPIVGTQLDLTDTNFRKVAKPELFEAITDLCETAMSDLGVSVLHLRRDAVGRFTVIKESNKHFRIGGASVQNCDAGTFEFTGPAAPLLRKPRGTFANCSGATTPWGTFLTCEENFQDQVPEFITPDGKPYTGSDGKKKFSGLGDPHPTNLPFEFDGLGTGLKTPLDGREYGWVCEIDPVNRTMKKHTALGRFRHENVALRVEAGKKLVAYMGDDRRGGHVWKFVSDNVVQNPKDPENTRLFEKGTLYVARWRGDFTGEWLPLTESTKLRRPEPEHATGGFVWLPRRPDGGHVAVGSGDESVISVDTWIKSVEAFARAPFEKMTLASLVKAWSHPPDTYQAERHGVIPTDAYVFANTIGGTPTARPEDIEVHPVDQSIYISFTDSTGSDDGSPDAGIFPDSAGKNTRQYGAVYRLAEKDNDPAATEFTWGKFVASGEAADGGGGFACADNLVFDPAANLWMVCDITTPAHNFPVDRLDKTAPGAKAFPGVFGNNAMFMIPTAGSGAGVPFCFATGPMECEMTGPTFTADGQTLIVSIQHPGELNGTRGLAGIKQKSQEVRDMKLAARDGTIFSQQRTVPLGSNFPSKKPGDLPRPAVVQITRV